MHCFKRILIATGFIPIISYFMIDTRWYHILFFSFILLISLVISFEFRDILHHKKLKISPLPLIISHIIIITSFWISVIYPPLSFLPYFSFIAIIFFILVPQIFKQNFARVVNHTSSFLLLLFYSPFLLGHLVLLKALPHGTYFLTLVIFMIWANDSFAYFTGVLFGKRWGLKASPNKSWAGVTGGLIFTVITAFGVNYLFQHKISFSLLFLKYQFASSFIFNPLWTLLMGFVIGVIVILSDLIESIFKRWASVKHSNNFLPGHGGLLDVFDSTLFSGVFFYYFLRILFACNIIS
ncbi:MAG: phosphatidate cytidylyltransferase [Spirochaetes bacterium]|nr:phosphatidate cytidylyltransferase [Spirochaetota bacterium]